MLNRHNAFGDAMRSHTILVYFILFITLFFSCRKESPSPSPMVVGDAIGYVIIGNDTVVINSNMPGFVSMASVNKVIGFPDNSHAIYSSQLYETNDLHPALIIKKGKLYFPDTIASDAHFIDFFETGLQNWSVNALDGVEVIYVDPMGTVWNTSEVGGYQGSHSFEITEAIPYMENGVRCIKFKAVFDCTLYHPAYQPIQLDKGVFIGTFRNL